jgi:hypothetical protein
MAIPPTFPITAEGMISVALTQGLVSSQGPHDGMKLFHRLAALLLELHVPIEFRCGNQAQRLSRFSILSLWLSLCQP